MDDRIGNDDLTVAPPGALPGAGAGLRPGGGSRARRQRTDPARAPGRRPHGLDIAVDKDDATPLHRQLRRQFTRLIDDDRLKKGETLPSTRALAEDLGVSRLTVLKAFQAMQRAGLIAVRPGRGYYVSSHGDAAMETADLIGVASNQQVPFEATFRETERSARDIPLSFAAGYPDVRLLPLRQVRRLFARCTAPDQCSNLVYAPPGGHPQLREELWRYLADRGIERRDDIDILVTNGAQHGLDIFARTFVKKTGTVAVESPTYYGALAAFRISGFDQVPVPQDAQGLSINALAALCRENRFDFLYTNPTFNNPSGMTLPVGRRKSLVRLARQHDFAILEDDTYSDLGFTGARLPSLMTLADDIPAFRIGSFSKSFFPGLRMGYIVGPKHAVRHMADLHGVNDMCSSTLSQVVLAEALASGFYARHVKRTRRIYHRRKKVMDTELAASLPPGCSYVAPKGGIFCWVGLPECIDSGELQRHCNAFGVDFAPGPMFSLEGHCGNFIRLNFTLLDEDDIRTGVRLLATQIQNLSPRSSASASSGPGDQNSH